MHLSEKIKLFKLLEENQAVVEFLNKEKEVENIKNTNNDNLKNNNSQDIKENDNIEDENDNDDFMLPNEHPENILQLNDIEEKLRDISILLENKKLREEQRRKIAILKNLFLQQKNIFLENETKKVIVALRVMYLTVLIAFVIDLLIAGSELFKINTVKIFGFLAAIVVLFIG